MAIEVDVAIIGAGVVGLAGALSTLGFAVIQSRLEGMLKMIDTCGVTNLHGMPGLMGVLLPYSLWMELAPAINWQVLASPFWGHSLPVTLQG